MPSLRAATLLVPADSRAAAEAVPGFAGGARARRVLRLLSWGHRHGLLRWTPMARLQVAGSGAPGVIPVLCAAVPGAETVIVWLGRPRPGRALVLSALDPAGRPLAFAKCAWDDGRRRLREEHAALEHMERRPVRGLRAPHPLGLLERDDYAMLVLEALDSETGDPGGVGPPVPVMLELAASRGWTELAVADLPVLGRLAGEIAGLTSARHRGWLTAALERVHADYGQVPTRAGVWHGDWVEWNMVRSPDQVLLWDWEHYETGVPAGLDHLHFLAQDLRQREGTGADAEDAWLELARTALRATWGQSPEEAEATLRIYLLALNVRFAADRDGLPDPPDRAGWGRELLTRLAVRQESDA